jgi:hypothetical protein
MSYSEWYEQREAENPMTIGPRRQQTFAALGEDYHSPQSGHEAKDEPRQPGIRYLPFSCDIFRKICKSFRVHESVTKTIVRSDVPSFSCEKVMMDQPAYGKQPLNVIMYASRSIAADTSNSLQLSHIEFFPIRYGLIRDLLSTYRSYLRHYLWVHVGYGRIYFGKTR